MRSRVPLLTSDCGWLWEFRRLRAHHASNGYIDIVLCARLEFAVQTKLSRSLPSLPHSLGRCRATCPTTCYGHLELLPLSGPLASQRCGFRLMRIGVVAPTPLRLAVSFAASFAA